MLNGTFFDGLNNVLLMVRVWGVFLVLNLKKACFLHFPMFTIGFGGGGGCFWFCFFFFTFYQAEGNFLLSLVY